MTQNQRFSTFDIPAQADLLVLSASVFLFELTRPVTDQMDSQPNPRRNLFVAVILAIIAGILLSTTYLSTATARQAKSETLKLGDSLALQSEILIRPLILANDRVSLNYLLNELIKIDHISGLQVQDRNGIVIARAGDVSDIKQVRHLLQLEKNIGSFTLWLNQKPAKQLLTSQHIPVAILAAMSILFILLAIWFTTRDTSISFTNDQTGLNPDEPRDFSSTLAIQTQQRALVDDESKEARNNTTKPVSVDNVIPTEQIISDHTVQEPQTEANKTDQISELSRNNHQSNNFKTDDLVDLLKPAPSSASQMPKFEHHPQDLETEILAEEEPLVLEEQDLNTSDTTASSEPAKENPLFKMQERIEKKEQQLELYSFEHELELILAPQDAIYLFYIDTITASSENIKAEEKSALVNVYLHLAKQVARIYNGEVEQLENNDILLRFELRDDKDSHGINALCAAVLFTLLYKGFNQSRIKGFQPVLSLQMSIARGHHSRYNLVHEESHFLTRTTHSNELISHTALSEAPLIKQALLENADIRREDEDKVLIMKLTAKHQELLQKQANHLLTKIFKK
ncbi:MAG: hypothetical protein ACRBB6_06285 [Neptuniibacter sp.]